MPNVKRAKMKYMPTMHEFAVLSAIRKSGGEFVDVATIMTCLRHRAQIEFPATGCHTILRRFDREGLVFCTEQSGQRGESRMFYTLTDQGHAFLTEWLGKIAAMQ